MHCTHKWKVNEKQYDPFFWEKNKIVNLPVSVFDQVTKSGIVVVVGLFVIGFFVLWVVVSIVTLDVGFVLTDTVIDGCVVWMILMVVFVGWLLVESGIGVAAGLVAIGFFRWVVDSVLTLEVGFVLVGTVIDGWVVCIIVDAVECVTPEKWRILS